MTFFVTRLIGDMANPRDTYSMFSGIIFRVWYVSWEGLKWKINTKFRNVTMVMLKKSIRI